MNSSTRRSRSPSRSSSACVELTGDADPGVRLDAVRALENTPVDQELLLAVLLPQLRVESDANVRQAIVRKLSARGWTSRPS